jgi:23S rRNA pseudouridine2605 synthase
VPLERAFSKLGLGSRSQAREWILAGRVSVGGRVVRDPAHAVRPESADLRLDGKPASRARPMTVLLHKPRGLVTTLSDEKGRETIFSVLRGLPEGLMPVGRLDQHTSGLLLLTNDSRLSDWLLDPANRVPRDYLVEVRGEAREELLLRLRRGLVDEGQRLQADHAEALKVSGRESRLLLRLREGRNREVRRLCAAVGLPVLRLKRVGFGGLELGDLPSGDWRELGREELERAFPGAPIRS